jgi:hypothetical protein
MGTNGTARERKTKGEKEGTEPREERRKLREKSRWKEYVGAVLAVIGLLIVLGGAFIDEGKPSKRPKKGVVKGGTDTGDLLTAALRLQELATLAAAVVDDDSATQTILDELLEIETTYNNSGDSMSQGLVDMAAQMRAQLLVANKGLSEEELQKEHGLATFGSGQYWEQKYAREKGETYDWYAGWEDTANDGRTLGGVVVSKLGPKDSRILVVGAGNSDMSKRLFDAGYTNLVNIDIAESVINEMKARHPEMEWQTMDATSMTYEDASFDLVIDKGTIDAVRASQQTGDIVGPLVKEVYRVVKPGRPFVIVSHSNDVKEVSPHCTSDVLEGARKSSSNLLVYVHNCPPA